MTIEEKTEQLKDKLKKLEVLDKKQKTFGAYSFNQGKQFGHEYKSYPVKETDLKLMESKLKIRLPEDYRDFLLKIGYGAGPGYGLNSQMEIIEERFEYSSNRVIEDGYFYEHELNEKTGYGRITYFRDLKHKHIEIYKDNIVKMKPKALGYAAPYVLSIEGAIVIANDGCTYSHVLVVEGELYGTVWDVGGFDPSQSIPEGICIGEKDGEYLFNNKVFTFSQWIEDWLDRSIEECIKKGYDKV
ncbi:SMI1/KNR4 family protein [Clostridium sp. C2-6-12]|uniref:SMI1/KNR4 family protein n=1 Tax=Clostridium sp. C2-6-12 TaxID=2698832 RepID=UPI001370A2E1|nr:SMI1/KNR4 family protein [Clostridium sp. C2-6-12]